MTAFDRAEKIAAWLGNLHPHEGPNDRCAIRDEILSAIHEEVAVKVRELEQVLAQNATMGNQINELHLQVAELREAAKGALRGLEDLSKEEAARRGSTQELCDYTFAKALRAVLK